MKHESDRPSRWLFTLFIHLTDGKPTMAEWWDRTGRHLYSRRVH